MSTPIARIRELLRAHRLTQAALAARTGIERTQLNRFLNGGRAATLEELKWIAEALGVTTGDLGIELDHADDARPVLAHLGDLSERLHRAESERDEARARAAAVESQLAQERQRAVAAWAVLERRVSRLETTLREPSLGRESGSSSLGGAADVAAVMAVALASGSIVPTGQG